jgi:hypothetical protein
VKAAKRMMETQSCAFAQISYRSVYENSNHFREALRNIHSCCRQNIKNISAADNRTGSIPCLLQQENETGVLISCRYFFIKISLSLKF